MFPGIIQEIREIAPLARHCLVSRKMLGSCGAFIEHVDILKFTLD